MLGEPCTTLVPGYGTDKVNILRLLRARASEEFDFRLFDVGDYARAVEQKVFSENISKVLYPNDGTPQGRELRLKQQYFFVACSLNDIFRRFLLKNADWDQLPDKAAIQLNDTHPVVAITELMRLLVDVHQVDWDRAWNITRRTFAYTRHTLLPEALEKWPVGVFGNLLPRHLEIVYEINHRFLDEVRRAYPGDEARLIRMSLIEEVPQRQLRMAHLATVGSFAIDGVAELQSRLLREHTLHDFAELWPEKFQNKTNGVTPRRFMRLANPRLSDLITSRIGDGWLHNLEQLEQIKPDADDPQFRQASREAKQQNKQDLAALARQLTGVEVDPASLFDVMVKRLHEYKRQLLKTLHIVALYQRVLADPHADIVPRTFVFRAKAAPGYFLAKRIIKLIHNLAGMINRDPGRAQASEDRVPRQLQRLDGSDDLPRRGPPRADLAGGKRSVGDGQHEVRLKRGRHGGDTGRGERRDPRARGKRQFLPVWPLTAEDVFALKRRGYNPRDYYETNPALRSVLDAIASGQFSQTTGNSSGRSWIRCCSTTSICCWRTSPRTWTAASTPQQHTGTATAGRGCRSSTQRSSSCSSPRTEPSDSTARRSGQSNPWRSHKLRIRRHEHGLFSARACGTHRHPTATVAPHSAGFPHPRFGEELAVWTPAREETQAGRRR